MTFRAKSLGLLSLAAIALICRPVPAAPLTAFGVDSALGGSMNFTSALQNMITGQIDFTAKNFSGTTTYQNVGLSMQFFYPAAANGAPTANGYGYLGGGSWSGFGQQLNITGVLAPYTSISQLLDPAQIDVPLNDSLLGFTAGPLLTTDSVPLIQLGDFAPGQSKDFHVTYTQTAGAPFRFVTDSFFVAVPEPATLAMAAIGGAMMVLVAARRRLRVR